MPIVLCCLPGVAVAAIVGVGAILGGAWLNGPLGLGLIALAALACPISMALMMRGAKRNTAPGNTQIMTDCCTPGDQAMSVGSDRLKALRAQREALEREVAEL